MSDHEARLARIKKLIDAQPGSQEFYELNALVGRAVRHEAETEREFTMATSLKEHLKVCPDDYQHKEILRKLLNKTTQKEPWFDYSPSDVLFWETVRNMIEEHRILIDGCERWIDEAQIHAQKKRQIDWREHHDDVIRQYETEIKTLEAEIAALKEQAAKAGNAEIKRITELHDKNDLLHLEHSRRMFAAQATINALQEERAEAESGYRRLQATQDAARREENEACARLVRDWFYVRPEQHDDLVAAIRARADDLRSTSGSNDRFTV